MWNKLITARPLLGALVLGGALTGATGCVDNTVSIYIRQIQSPTLTGTMCTTTSDPSALSIAEGTLDLALADSYSLRPLLANQLLTRANMDQLRAETSTVNVQGFVIELHEGSPDGPLIGPAFSVYQNIVVPAAASVTTPNYNYGQIQVIPPQIGEQLKTAVCHFDMTGVTPDCPVVRITSENRRVLVKMTAFGESLGQNNVESPPFYFPVTVCCGCLLNFPADSDMADTTAMIGPDCNNGSPVLSSADCNPGQDFRLDCRSCSHSNPSICQPRGFSPTGAVCPR